MASSPNKGNIPKSRSNQTVCLADWWLVKTENDVQGRRLAVSGFTCRGQGGSSTFSANKSQAMRVFSSAPILKRHDTFTIETTDGICVIFKGLINKARTVENGFPSDVFNHFVFGFPLYWKEYEENCMDKESSSNDISGSNLLEIPRPLPEIEPHAENCENDLESRCKIDVKKSDSLIIGSECNLSMPLVAPGGLEDESYSMGPVLEDPPTLDDHVLCQTNKMESLSDLSVNDKVVFDSQVNATGGVLLDVGSSRDIPCHSESRVRTRSMSSLKAKHNNDEKSAKVSGGEEIRNCEPGSKNNCNSEVAVVHGSTDKLKKPTGFEAGVEGESVQVSKTPNRGSDLRKVKTEGYVKKAKSKSNVSSGMKNRRNLAYETPDREKDEACGSFNRSRSGRLLVPAMEFWRNQKPIYDGGRIIGIEEGSLPEQSKGSPTPVKRKRGRRRKLR